MLDKDVIQFTQTLWNYMQLNHNLQKADTILALGSHDLRVGEYAAQLYLDGWAPFIICSGGFGNQTRGIWQETEAEKFAHIAREKGVPQDSILVENQSTNTGENILFTRKLIEEKNFKAESFILVHKPYMERRAYATFRKLWPEKQVLVTSPPIPFLQYPTIEIRMEDVIHIMVGDFQRILVYPLKGFQTPQEVPERAQEAYKALVKRGFTEHLLPK
ncbi:MAG TPA: YdcF family protein [Anaerolineae bacterium]|nr:YdcF family protein [Anaerolineae bacterium]